MKYQNDELNFGLSGKRVLVTGGSRGIGLELARELLRQKARVAICARKQEGLNAAVAELGKDIIPIQAHIAKEDDVSRMFEIIQKEFKGLDVLINNAGMNLPSGNLIDTEYAAWQKIIDSNLNGTFLVSRAAAQLMRNSNGGKIVTVSSIAAHRASPAMGAYGIAKAGIEMLTKVLASELAAYGICVNAVAPAMVKTDFSKPFWGNPTIHDMIVKRIPLGRIAEIYDVVYPVLFFASPCADFITGQVLLVDGGASAV
ncbi:MAG: SDR family oxidoreductase [Spirochaetes bacterium]|nr:SDR family oxidoreductase [Spirochaetota bacterium]